MITNDVSTSYFWRDDKYIKREFHVTTFQNGQKVEATVEYVVFDRRGKEVREAELGSVIDKLI